MYTAELIPAGLHASLSIILDPTTLSISSACPLFLHLSLPPSFIGDRFQLNQLHTEGRLGSYDGEKGNSFGFKGERDLEVPVYKAEESELLIRLIQSGNNDKGKGKEILKEGIEEGKWEIPLHLRYQVPVKERYFDGKRNDTVLVTLNYPLLFWACETEEDALTITSIITTTNCPVSFDYPSLLNTSSLHLLTPSTSNAPLLCPPLTQLPILSISAPTGVLSDLPFVESLNFIAIWSGMILISWAVYRLRKRLIVEEKMGEGKKES